MRVVHLLSILSEVGRSFNFVVLVCHTDLFLQHLLDSIAGRASDHPSLLSHFLFWASPLDNCGSGTHIAEGSRAQLGGGGAGCIAGRWSWCSVVQQSPRWFLTTEVRSGFGRGVERWVGLKKACKKRKTREIKSFLNLKTINRWRSRKSGCRLYHSWQPNEHTNIYFF